MSLAIPFLVLLLCGFFVYRILAPSRPRASRPGTTGVASGSDGGSCGDSGGGGGGGD